MNRTMTKRVGKAGTSWVVWVLAVACFVGVYPAVAQDPVFHWAAGFTGSENVDGTGVAVDASGNVYITGLFRNTVDFDPGPGTFDLTEDGDGIRDIFLVKLDRFGKFVWANRKGGSSGVANPNLTVDASGNVYSTGEFESTVDFDPGAGTFNLTSTGRGDVFVQKLDSAGNFMWAGAMGGTGTDLGSDIAVDASGNVYIAGRFNETVDFDPGPGTFNITSAGGWDMFACKLDPAGDFVWASVMGGADTEGPPVIAVDTSGNVYTTGWFNGPADFDPGPGTFNLTNVGGSGIFVSKLDSAGNFAWAKAFGGSGPFEGGAGIAVDASGNVYTTGGFDSTVDFDPGPGTATIASAGFRDVFVCKLDTLGNFVWAKTIGGTGDDTGLGIALDVSDNVYTTGTFGATVDFDPGAGTFNLTSPGGNDAFTRDAFVSKLDSAGNFIWAGAMGGPSFSSGDSIALGASGDVYIRGTFAGTSDFDPGPGTFNLDSDARGVFLVKLRQGSSLPRIVSNPPSGFVEVGGSAALTLVGDVLEPFQWFKNGDPMVNAPPRVTGTNSTVLSFDPAEPGDSGIYHATYDNGVKAPAQTPGFELQVVPDVPLLGVLGLAGLAAMVLAAGFVVVGRRGAVRRKKQHG